MVEKYYDIEQGKFVTGKKKISSIKLKEEFPDTQITIENGILIFDSTSSDTTLKTKIDKTIQ